MNSLFKGIFAVFLATLNCHVLAVLPIDVLDDEGCLQTDVEDITDQIKVVDFKFGRSTPVWKFVPDVAHNKNGDWGNCMAVAHRVTPELAMLYAENDVDVTFFFFVKGERLILANTKIDPPVVRIFHYGDAVFFKGHPRQGIDWCSMPGLAEGYIKKYIYEPD